MHQRKNWQRKFRNKHTRLRILSFSVSLFLGICVCINVSVSEALGFGHQKLDKKVRAILSEKRKTLIQFKESDYSPWLQLGGIGKQEAG